MVLMRKNLRRFWARYVRKDSNAPVLLYHSVSACVPRELARGLHNVRPDVFAAHLEWLRRRYRIVFVDEFAVAEDRSGLAAITFDDAYVSVFREAWPVLQELNIPATVFVNGAVMCGSVFWRDKVRCIINAGLVAEFEQVSGALRKRRGQAFYEYSKDPRNDSAVVTELIDTFLSTRAVASDELRFCVNDPDQLVRSPLLSYGNHGQNHFVMSSLSRERQAREIAETQAVLKAVPGITISKVFAVPFGGTRDCNGATHRLIQEAGYLAAAMSRNRLNRKVARRGRISVIERLMPDERPLDVQLGELR